MYIVLSDYEDRDGVGLTPRFVDSVGIAVLDTDGMVVNALSFESLKRLIIDNGKRLGHSGGCVEIYWDKLSGLHYLGNGSDYDNNKSWILENIWLPSLEARFKISLLNGKYSIRDNLIKNNATNCTLDFMDALGILSSALGQPDIVASNLEMVTGVGFFDLPTRIFKVQLMVGLGLFVDLCCDSQTLKILHVDIWSRFLGRYNTLYSLNITGDFKKYMARYSLVGRSEKCI